MGHPPLRSKDANVRAAAAAYGNLGTKNGVHISFAAVRQQGIKGSVEGRNNNGVGKVIDVEVVIDISLKGSSLRETITHEGTHVQKNLNFLTSYDFGTGKYDSNSNFTGEQTEFDAYKAGAGVNREHGFGPNDTQRILNYIHGNYPPTYLNNQYYPNNAAFPQ